MFKARFTVKQSNILVLTDTPLALEAAYRSLLVHRALLDEYVEKRPWFKLALSPVKVEDWAPHAAKLAAEAAEIAGVGPMAAVAGALAEVVMWDMVRAGAKLSVVENGGEISAISPKRLNIAVHAGPSPLSGKVGFEVSESDFPIGIATSSASVSKAINLGLADAAVVVAEEAAIADAAAKAVCNAVIGEDEEGSIKRGLEAADDLKPYIRGALIIRGRHIGLMGKLPRLIGFKPS
ncbi:MAG: hypothetical protein DRJ98_03085 [Thermoprotei archaeon]|nr:MAG: hypothetical protein DRJ98_03085 [Thermoprotei archaeon]RLF18477.1 MAG: hypothetical protein DRN06_01405 [Thermoprotei archaeon]